MRFVIQEHRARNLHYDFRLEADGVLKSWAIPKGPSLDPRDRRLAMHVEDHPLEYRRFEGTIPKGHYGAGEVIVWDEGTYASSEGSDPAAEIGKGKITFVLRGRKMRGKFTLVRIKRRSGENGDPWLLIKDHDKPVKTPQKRARVPHITTPMLATLIGEPFDDDEWLFEIKWDGYRAICTVHEDGRVELVSRNGLDFLNKFPELRALGAAWTALPIVVDGEIVSLDAHGRSSFQRLQESLSGRRASATGKHGALTFAAFDVLYANGRDLRKTPLEERKAILQRSIASGSAVLYSKHVVGRGRALFAQAKRRGLEGIIGKRRRSLYLERRSRDWVKIKAQLVQECVIGGFTEPRGSRTGFGSLLLGLYDGGKLQYAGSAGTGFNAKLLRSLTADLKKLERKSSPFENAVEANAKPHFVRPKLVAQIRFTEWTRDGYMRHPAFLGLRIDKDPRSCVRERSVDF